MSTHKDHHSSEKPHDNSSIMLGTGLGLGAYAGTTTVLLGYTCPLCIVAAPALIGVGLYKKLKKPHPESGEL